jgi:signal peptidase I
MEAEEATLDEVQPQVMTKKPFSIGKVSSELFKTALLAVLIFTLARTVVLPFEVEGSSMAPNLENGERVLVNRSVYYHFDLYDVINLIPGTNWKGDHDIYLFHEPERGEILVLNPPTQSEKPFIKRLIAHGGEHVSFSDGYVYIDGERLDESYVEQGETYCRGQYCDLTVPDGYVYVLGDNRTNSTDSRFFGPVNLEQVIGKAWFANWPLDDFGRLPHYDYDIDS